MNGKKVSFIHSSLSLTVLVVLTVVTSTIIMEFSLNDHQITIAQQQAHVNLTSDEKQKALEGISFQFGIQVAYSYAAAHPNETKRLVILHVPVGGIGPGGNITGLWWAQFHNVHDIPEMLVTGHEREYLTWFYRYSCNPAAITEEDIDEYVSHYSSPGGMRAGFEYYRALSEDIKQNKEYSMIKLPMPVLVLGGECSFGDAALDSMRVLATDVRGSVIPNTGHWIPEEQPKFLADQLFKFFAANSTKTK